MTVYAGKRYRFETNGYEPWNVQDLRLASGASGHYRTPPLTWAAAIGGGVMGDRVAFEPSADGPFYAVFAPTFGGPWETVLAGTESFVCWIERT